MSAFYQVVPSDGVGGASGHGLLAAAKGLLRSRGGLVVSTANDSLFSVKCLSFFGGPHHWTYSNSRHDFFPLIDFTLSKCIIISASLKIQNASQALQLVVAKKGRHYLFGREVFRGEGEGKRPSGGGGGMRIGTEP